MLRSHQQANLIFGLLLLALVVAGGCKVPFNSPGSLSIAKPSSVTEPLPPTTGPTHLTGSADLSTSRLDSLAERIQDFSSASRRFLGAVTVGVSTALIRGWFENLFHEETEIDRLWQQGYGYNNPNPDRIKKGQPVLNFDGKVAR